MLTPKRLDTPELLDEHDAPPADMERSLRDLRRFNRYAGGTGIYRRLVKRMAPNREEKVTVVDLGTGTSDLLESLDDYPRLLPIGVDFRIEHMIYLRHRSRVRRVVGDAKQLPFREGSADVITSSHFFHHFSPAENVEILRDSLRVARRGVIVSDTRRHYVPLLFVLLLGVLRLVGRITRFDAPASVRRGYTTAEAGAIGDGVVAKRTEAVNVWPFRFGLLLWK